MLNRLTDEQVEVLTEYANRDWNFVDDIPSIDEIYDINAYDGFRNDAQALLDSIGGMKTPEPDVCEKCGNEVAYVNDDLICDACVEDFLTMGGTI